MKEMTAADVKTAPRDFLEKNLVEHTRKGPAVWDMVVYVGEPGDPQDDPTLAWPERRGGPRVSEMHASDTIV
jgi:catalase